MYSKSSQILTAAAFSMFVLCVQPSFADHLSDGAAAYGAGNFAVAKTHFLKAVAAKPKSWEAQYQLANTYVALKDSANAKASYNKCVALHPPADIRTNCSNALAYISTNPKLIAPTRPAPPIQVQMVRPKDSMPASSGTASGELPAPGEGESKPEVKPEIAAQRARIMKEADAEVEKLKAQEKERHAELEQNANQRYIMPDGTVQIKMSEEEEARFQKEVEQKVAQIKDKAKRRAEAIK